MKASWKRTRLVDICQPKQWKTIPLNKLKDSGYSVYGANGKIGYYDGYNHEKPTLLITCRGATCGQLNISEPYSYVTGNAMALDNLNEEKANLRFLFYALMYRKLRDVVSGSAQPQITRQGLKSVSVDLPPVPEQRRIAAILDKADAVQRKRQEAIGLMEEFLQSVFLEMFGDPVTNSKDWVKKPIKELGKVVTGNTPPRKKDEYYGDHIEWIKSDNINTPFHFITEAAEYLSEEGKRVGRTVPPHSILITCIAGSPECIGNVALTDREVAFNQQINAIIPFESANPYFVYTQLLVAKRLIQRASTNSMKGLVSKRKFESVLLLLPPLEKQNQFAKIMRKYLKGYEKLTRLQNESNTMFNSLVQRAFREN